MKEHHVSYQNQKYFIYPGKSSVIWPSSFLKLSWCMFNLVWYRVAVVYWRMFCNPLITDVSLVRLHWLPQSSLHWNHDDWQDQTVKQLCAGRPPYERSIQGRAKANSQISCVFFATDHRKKAFIYSTLETFAYLEQHVQCKEEMKCVVGYFKETIKFAFLFLILDGNYFSKSGSISYYQ